MISEAILIKSIYGLAAIGAVALMFLNHKINKVDLNKNTEDKERSCFRKHHVLRTGFRGRK